MATLVQCILASRTGFPKDNVVNTFHFVEDEMSPTQVQECGDAITAFYNDVATGSTEAVGEYISQVISRASGACQLKFYNTLVAGVGPYAVGTWTLGPDGAEGFPSEVAVCLSYKQAGATGLAGRRQRGRIFVGPMAQNSNAATAIGQIIVSSQCTNDIMQAGIELHDTAEAATWGPWVVHSTYGSSIVPGSDPPRQVNPPDVQTDYPIDYLWVDDAYDTQRRRGEVPISRRTHAF